MKTYLQMIQPINEKKIGEKIEGKNIMYSLRKFSVVNGGSNYFNIKVGDFQRVDGSQHHMYHIKKDFILEKDGKLQIYPGDQTKTLYPFGAGQVLSVVCQKGDILKECGTVATNDVYLYFVPPPSFLASDESEFVIHVIVHPLGTNAVEIVSHSIKQKK